MGGIERGADLCEDPQRVPIGQALPPQTDVESFAVDPTHHLVDTTGLAPRVLHTDDLRVVELGDPGDVSPIPRNEAGVVGERGTDDTYRHLATDRTPVAAIQIGIGAGDDTFAQLVTANGTLDAVDLLRGASNDGSLSSNRRSRSTNWADGSRPSWSTR